MAGPFSLHGKVFRNIMENVAFNAKPRAVDASIMAVDVEGDVDVSTSPLLRQCVEQLIDAEHPNLIINLTRSPYVDSTGLGLLVQLLKQCQTKKKALAFVVPFGHIRDLLVITGVERILSVFDNEAAAVAHLSKRP